MNFHAISLYLNERLVFFSTNITALSPPIYHKEVIQLYVNKDFLAEIKMHRN